VVSPPPLETTARHFEMSVFSKIVLQVAQLNVNQLSQIEQTPKVRNDVFLAH
jgi:hypothetical protein